MPGDFIDDAVLLVQSLGGGEHLIVWGHYVGIVELERRGTGDPPLGLIRYGGAVPDLLYFDPCEYPGLSSLHRGEGRS